MKPLSVAVSWFYEVILILPRVGCKWMLSTSHVLKLSPVLLMPFPPLAPNKGVPRLLSTGQHFQHLYGPKVVQIPGDWGTQSSPNPRLCPSLSSWLCYMWPQTGLWNHFVEHQTLPNWKITKRAMRLHHCWFLSSLLGCVKGVSTWTRQSRPQENNSTAAVSTTLSETLFSNEHVMKTCLQCLS